MGIISRSVSIAANANVDDQLVADAVRLQQRTAQADGEAQVWATESATGLRLDIISGDQNPGSNLEPNVRATAPNLQDDMIASVPILGGEVFSLPVRNTTAGALTLNYRIAIP